jgi:hypothetical protein
MLDGACRNCQRPSLYARARHRGVDLWWIWVWGLPTPVGLSVMSQALTSPLRHDSAVLVHPPSMSLLLACRTLASSSRSWARNTVRSFATTSPSAALGEKPPRPNATRPPRPRSPRQSPRSTTKAPSPAANFARAQSAEHSRQVVPRSRSSAAAEEEAPRHGKRERSLLRPYELSGRLIELCKQGDIDLAVSTLERAPRNAQNVKVWNTLIQKCMDAKKYKLAYGVFTDVRRPLMPIPFPTPPFIFFSACLIL